MIKYQCSGWLKYKKGSSDLRGFTYTYDAAGNISRIVTAGTSVPKAAQLKEYTYDAQGQLVSEKNSSKTTFLYAYDTAGNIRSITKDGTVTKSFGYTNASWPDLLTSVTANGTTKDVLYEGQSQTSDLPSSGNPVTYYNGKDYTFTWTKGRQLASATVDGKQVSYTYDMSGVRTSKTVNGTTYNYTTLSGKVMRQTWGNKSLEFVYDDGNQPFAMIYNDGSTSTLYYYVLNAQGDVIALLNSAGALVASYNYGAWGNYSVHGADGKKTTDATFIGHINPLRYRGYYYDRETRLYYLQSRYYDFANCRFINADGLLGITTFLGCNLFSYCNNNPINCVDPLGTMAAEAITAATNFWNPVGWVAATVLGIEILVTGIAIIGAGMDYLESRRNSSGSNSKADPKPSSNKNPSKNDSRKSKKTSKQTGKERATDKPSYVNKGMVDRSLSAQQNAKDILNNQFGPGNWNKGPGSDFNKIVKWINRSGLFVWSLGNTDRLQADENGDYFIFLYSEGIMS